MTPNRDPLYARGVPAPIEVVIPTTHRSAAWLREAAASASACEGVRAIRIVDDGSAETVDPQTLRASLRENVELEVVRQSRAGPAAARNAGLGRVRDAHAILLDDDDVLLPAGVSAMVALADRVRAMAVVAAREEVFPNGELRLKPVPPEWTDAILPRAGDVFRPLAIFGASGCLLTRAALATGDRFDPRLMIGEDRDFLRRLAAHGPIAVSALPAVRVRIHDVRRGRSLSTAHVFDRRIADHAVLVERWCDDDSAGHFQDATRWLVNSASKADIKPDSWRTLLDLCRRRGWAIPLRARARAALTRFRR